MVLNLPGYKKGFINSMINVGALLFGEFELDSGRHSSYFYKADAFNTGDRLGILADAYASSIIDSKLIDKFDSLCFVREKGILIGTATAISLAKKGYDKSLFYLRNEPKFHGETTNPSKEEMMDAMTVGRRPSYGERPLLIDDVISTGKNATETWIKSRETYVGLDLVYAGLLVSLYRMEVDMNGKPAVSTLKQNTGLYTYWIVDALDIIKFLVTEENIDPNMKNNANLMINHLNQYGTERAKINLNELEKALKAATRK